MSLYDPQKVNRASIKEALSRLRYFVGSQFHKVQAQTFVLAYSTCLYAAGYDLNTAANIGVIDLRVTNKDRYNNYSIY